MVHERDWEMAELETKLRAEVRGEESALEADALEGYLASRTLRDLALEVMNQGDELHVEIPSQKWRGVVDHVGDDFFRLIATNRDVVAVRLGGGVALRRLELAPAGGRSRSLGPKKFVALLRQLMMEERLVELHGSWGTSTPGVIKAVAPDHVLVLSGESEAFLPLDHIDAVVELA